MLYALCFVWIVLSVWVWLVIFITHFFIDRYRLATYWIRYYNGVNVSGPFGYEAGKPDYMTLWLMVIVDNTMHLVINFLAIVWL